MTALPTCLFVSFLTTSSLDEKQKVKEWRARWEGGSGADWSVHRAGRGLLLAAGLQLPAGPVAMQAGQLIYLDSSRTPAKEMNLPTRSRAEWAENETRVGVYTFRVAPEHPILTILGPDNGAFQIFAPAPGDPWRTKFDQRSGDYRDYMHAYMHSDNKVGVDEEDGPHCHIEFGMKNGRGNFNTMEDQLQINKLIENLMARAQ
jgi:hypothetical protein